MGRSTGAHLAVIVQRFVNGHIDAPEMMNEAQALVGSGVDITEHLLTALAEGGIKLQPPPGRETLIYRLEQYAKGETSFTELDLWFFAVSQADALAVPVQSPTPEIELLRSMIEWSQLWEDESVRPPTRQFAGLAAILREILDPEECRKTLEAAITGGRAN